MTESFDPKFRDLGEIFEASTKQHADRPLFGTKQAGQWLWLSYGEFRDQVERARAALAGLGVQKGDRVAVISDNRPEWAVGAYACYGLAAAYVPMYEAQRDKDWQFILDNCGAKVLFVANEDIAKRVEAFRGALEALREVVVFDGTGGAGMSFAELLERGASKGVAPVAVTSDDIAGFIYTSGTTGNPKGVMLSHGNMASNVSAIHARFPLGPDDRSLSFLPWAHVFGQVVELHGLFSMGASLGIAESTDKIVPNLAEVQPTLLFAVPRIFNRIYEGVNRTMTEAGGLKKTLFDAALRNETERKKLAAEGRTSGWVELKHRFFDKLVFSKVRARFGGKLKYAVSGAAAISVEVAEFVDNLGIDVYEGYGLSETSPIVTFNYPGHRRIGTVGKPAPGVTVEIDKSVTGDPRDGEIVVYGHCVMQGYYGLDEANKEVFVERDGRRGLRTGDMGYVDDDGYLHITGRIREQYKLMNGKYVMPTPIEEQLKLSPYIANAMVYGLNRQHNVALVVPEVPMLREWAKKQGLDGADGDAAALVARPEVRELIKGEIEAHSKDIKGYERVRDFTLTAEDFTTENGLLTPTMKLKRRNVLKEYGEQIEALYE
ncbi:MAG: long-chain fatty acid--CoA ligase [Myxococcales bacterium]|nr:long-chain fatty acid--CoA ligase [Myxococcales bacterium]